MRRDFEKISERMELASLKELMPDFDKEAEWARLSAKLQGPKQGASIPRWYYAAAILLLLAGCIWFMLPTAARDPGDQQTITRYSNPPVQSSEIVSPADTSAAKQEVVRSDKQAIDTNAKNKNIAAAKKHKTGGKEQNVVSSYTAKDFICNGTPCPIQICINQTVHCPHVEPATISSCSTLEPDQSGQLRYKAHDKIAKNCSLTINEIEIRSIATGETILLNTNSTPSTAQEVFSYITGQKKGDILAGMFHSDCNHKTRQHGIRLTNSFGDLIIQ